MRAWLLAWVALLALSCGKVGLLPVDARFRQADASWFAAEQTLFVFYDVDAQQGLGGPSRVELRYTTDDEIVGWTPIDAFETVHTHVPVDCGVTSLCGSTSLRVTSEPREIGIRLRYNPEGALALEAGTALVYNVVDSATAPGNRSFVVYGVFGERNELVQWRGRHQFPSLRNRRAQVLGLRRDFTIRDQRYGTNDLPPPSNPYGYAIPCPEGFTGTDLAELTTNERASWNANPLPVAAGSSGVVCAEASVRDAAGSFTTTAYARKNPEVRQAFPELRSPIRDATVLPWFLAPCGREISAEHEAMQRQRLQMENVPTTCADNAASDGFRFQLAVEFLEAIERERPRGNDMVIVVGVHQDDDDVADAVEQALSDILPRERHRSSPRVVGAFVFDSESRSLSDSPVENSALWCPSRVSTSTTLPNASEVSCPVLPDEFGVLIGPIQVDALPILPPRVDYLDFIDDFSPRQAGTVENLRFLAPEFPTTSQHTDLGDFGVVTFLNGERIDADGDDAFSFCQPEEFQPFVVRSELMQNDQLAYLLADYCVDNPTGPIDSGTVPLVAPPGIDVPTDGYGSNTSICEAILLGLLPIDALPDWHSLFSETEYQVGLFWQFPFLLRMDYEAVTAASVTAFGVTIPFGFASENQTLFGAPLWEQDVFRIDPTLLQCRRFCDNPTFDSAGVYNVRAPFRTTYARTCYTPRYPQTGDDGFPIDP
ncbi:MAG: hypothetical protein AAF602_02120 [Myxococcota bacterium]